MSFPCISCGVVLPNSQQQRDHYKSDWHRYNLKRKVTGLLPVTLDEFYIKSALFVRPNDTEEKAEETKLPHCPVCHKKFSGHKAYENHLSSKKHQQRAAEAGARQQQHQQQQQQWEDQEEEEEAAGSDGDGDTPLGLEECLFCSCVSASLEANYGHMLKQHGFALPDADCLSDLEGLATLLAYKVGVGLECLWCHDARTFGSVRAVQQHMADSGHCRYSLAGEHAFDLADFYDFGDVVDGDGDGEEEEEDEEEEDGEEAYELVLPSGSVAGHRSLVRYFRQSLPPRRQLATRPAGRTARLLSQYRSLGWSWPQRTPAQAAAIRDVAFVQRHRQRLRLRLGLRANRLQKHFRSQNPI